ncbi:U-box domain-containing protein 10 [Raphanus sativus]|uniref:RING-type E3 ubiquitin transferase n=1 Tax=Raphanus sativus TaxID=3726 RepID=A0A9W3CY93_RAPSA|nr:U-box domain-containing protein 10-like [Raphanus sativus]KAJ4867628.1 U-box domain-containing protein 10 [Raphanus sativus]
MAGVAVSPASLLLVIAEIAEISASTGVFKKDCADLARRVCLLTHLVEEIRDSPPQTLEKESDASPSLVSCECDWWSDLVVGLQAAKRLLSAATCFQARESSEGAAKRISFQFQCVTWKLEKALGNLPYDRYDISDEVREYVELARLQLRRAMQRYGSLNSKKFSTALSEPMEKDASSKVTEKLECIPESVHSNAPLSDEKKLESPPRRKSSSVSLAFFLSKDADNERLEKAITKSNDDDSKKSDNLTIPEDFLCPISLELMKDPVIVSTGQTYERSYIQRWIDCGNLRCPKTQQKLGNFTLTPNYVLRSLISQWCTKHNIEQPGGYMNGRTKNCDGDMSAIRALVRKLSSRSIQDRRTALSEIRSLSKRNTDNRILIAEAGAIPVLVNLLTSEDVETQEKAVTCVLNLSIYESNKELIMLAGAVTSIVQVLRAGTAEAKENAAATLFSLSLADENKIIIGASGAIPALVNLLENGSVRGKKDAATALFNLCIYEGNKGRAVRAGVVSPLVKMLNDTSSHRMVTEALTILSVLASNQDAKTAVVRANAIPSLIVLLQKDQPRNRENAAAILFALCKRDTEKLILIGKLGAVVPLMELSRDGTERAKRKANSLLEQLRKSSQKLC